MQGKRKKFIQHTQNPFSPTTIYNKEKKCAHGTNNNREVWKYTLTLVYNEEALCKENKKKRQWQLLCCKPITKKQWMPWHSFYLFFILIKKFNKWTIIISVFIMCNILFPQKDFIFTVIKYYHTNNHLTLWDLRNCYYLWTLNILHCMRKRTQAIIVIN